MPETITETTPMPPGYGVRACRGHFHVYVTDEAGNEGEDIAIPGDPFKSRDAALAGLFAYLDAKANPRQPSPMSEPRDAMSDERLAEIRKFNDGLRQRLHRAASLCVTDGHMSASTVGNVVDSIDALLAEVERLRASAQLGSALVEALREVKDGAGLDIYRWTRTGTLDVTHTGDPARTDATRALASLLAAFPQESR